LSAPDFDTIPLEELIQPEDGIGLLQNDRDSWDWSRIVLLHLPRRTHTGGDELARLSVWIPPVPSGFVRRARIIVRGARSTGTANVTATIGATSVSASVGTSTGTNTGVANLPQASSGTYQNLVVVDAAASGTLTATVVVMLAEP
jgi:hypothetical protein